MTRAESDWSKQREVVEAVDNREVFSVMTELEAGLWVRKLEELAARPALTETLIWLTVAAARFHLSQACPEKEESRQSSFLAFGLEVWLSEARSAVIDHHPPASGSPCLSRAAPERLCYIHSNLDCP